MHEIGTLAGRQIDNRLATQRYALRQTEDRQEVRETGNDKASRH